MKGDTRTFIEGLPADTVNDLTQLQAALTTQYHGAIHVNSVRAQLRTEKWRVDGTPPKMFSRLQPLIMKIHAGATQEERDNQLKAALWDRLPSQVTVLATGHTFTTAAALRDFATQLLDTLKCNPLSTIGLVDGGITGRDMDVKRSIDDLAKQIISVPNRREAYQH